MTLSTDEHIMTPALQEGRVLDALDDTCSAFEAFNWLLCNALRHPEAADAYADGVHALFDLQRLALNGIRRSVADMVEERARVEALSEQLEGAARRPRQRA